MNACIHKRSELWPTVLEPWDPIFSGVSMERKSFLVSVNRPNTFLGKYFPRSGTVNPAPDIYGRPNSLGKRLGEDF